MEYVVQALKVLKNLVHAEANARAQRTGFFVSFLSSRVCLSVYQIFQNFASLYNILHILTQVIQTSCLVTHFCAQAVFKVPVNNTFPIQKNDIIRNNFSARRTRVC